MNTPDAVFCSKCGSKMAPPSTEVAPVVRAPAEQERNTVPEPEREGGTGAEAGAGAEAEAKAPKPQRKLPARRRVAGQARTMVGMGLPDTEAIAAARAVAAEKKAKKEAAKSAQPSGPQPSGPPTGAPPKRVHVAGQGRTMLGVQAPDKAVVAAAVEQARKNREERDKGASERPKRSSNRPEDALDPLTNRTMLGQPAPRVASSEAPPPRSSGQTNQEKQPRGLDAKSSSGRMRAPVIYPTDAAEEEALTLPTKGPGKGVAIGALVVGLVVLAIGGGALAWALMAGGSAIHASVVQGPTGEMLEIEVPGAEAGTSVRFGGEEQELEASRARFALAAEDLSLGDNELSVDVVAPDGTVETETVELYLEMRVRADLGPLSNAPPAIEVIVEAPPGSTASLEGDALTLDAQGRGSRRFTIQGSAANAEGLVEHVVRYRVRPPDGEEAQGELRTRIPLTTLQLDRPGAEVVTDQTSVEFAGAVAPGATVTVGGATAQVTDGRFVYPYALPEVGEQTVEVVARHSGRAPRVAEVRIRRVADLEAEAASFEVNEELTYARIAQNPATYRGQHVAFEGQVYNVEVRNGRSMLQILVSECPDGERCPLWVSYPSATETELRSRIRVLGAVAGEQQFRSQSGEIRTVPRVDATFILPGRASRR